MNYLELNTIYNDDCMNIFPNMSDNNVDLTLTDIPYDNVNRNSGGLRNLDKSKADILTFDLSKFLDELYRVTKKTIIIFCGREQFSQISNYFNDYQLNHMGTVRQLIWHKTNPSPMNGKSIYLSGCENAVWFKKPNATFNAFCKSNVFSYPIGTSNLHPTEKNHLLLKELILDNSNENDVIFDPCCGSGSHLLVAKLLNRKYLGVELNKEWFDIAKKRLDYGDSTNINAFYNNTDNEKNKKLF